MYDGIGTGRYIIPYQELSGNYNFGNGEKGHEHIIPYQELSGNYNPLKEGDQITWIIPYQELSGNYNRSRGAIFF